MKSPDPNADLGLLAALGFGPEAKLAADPKLFVDATFLGCLIAELEDELGADGARRAFFEIGLMHGLRDSVRVVRGDCLPGRSRAGRATVESTPLRIRMTPRRPRSGSQPAGGSPPGAPGSLELQGSWPGRHEAEARLARLGPEPAPCCYLSAGYTSGWLSGLLDADMLAIEAQCCARGDAHCEFVAREMETWRESGEPAAVGLLATVPYDAFRDLAARDAAAPPRRPGSVRLDSEGDFDRESAAVHVWGPVMVLPYTQADEAMRTIELLANDPDTRGVRSVILDLRGAILDEGFDAAAVEHVLSVVEAWGAEAILTGVSQLSEPVVADLAQAHLLIRKDLPEAIASAFQIADAQRYAI